MSTGSPANHSSAPVESKGADIVGGWMATTVTPAKPSEMLKRFFQTFITIFMDTWVPETPV